MNAIERIEKLVEKNAEWDLDFDELVEVHTALPDLLKVARAAQALDDFDCEQAPQGPCGECDFCRLRAALEPLLREEGPS